MGHRETGRSKSQTKSRATKPAQDASREETLLDTHPGLIGVDPGNNGGMALLSAITGECIDLYAFRLGKGGKRSEHDVFDKLVEWSTDRPIIRAAIENVASRPAQGVVSAFTFGKVFGFLQGILVAIKVPLLFVTPSKWCADLSFKSEGIKSRSRIRARFEFPRVEKITNDTADALLIARWLYLIERGSLSSPENRKKRNYAP